MFPLFSGSVPNSFEAIEKSLNPSTKKTGIFFGNSFESDIRDILFQSGYVNKFQISKDERVDEIDKAASMIGGAKVSNAEFDAMVYGNSKNFEIFSAQFLDSYRKFPPTCSHTHGLIVEVKLNSQLLIDWAVDEKRSSGP